MLRRCGYVLCPRAMNTTFELHNVHFWFERETTFSDFNISSSLELCSVACRMEFVVNFIFVARDSVLSNDEISGSGVHIVRVCTLHRHVITFEKVFAFRLAYRIDRVVKLNFVMSTEPDARAIFHSTPLNPPMTMTLMLRPVVRCKCRSTDGFYQKVKVNFTV